MYTHALAGQVDTMIVQAIGLLDELDKEINTYAMRVKEWYGWHFPELAKVCVCPFVLGCFRRLTRETGMGRDKILMGSNRTGRGGAGKGREQGICMSTQ